MFSLPGAFKRRTVALNIIMLVCMSIHGKHDLRSGELQHDLFTSFSTCLEALWTFECSYKNESNILTSEFKLHKSLIASLTIFGIVLIEMFKDFLLAIHFVALPAMTILTCILFGLIDSRISKQSYCDKIGSTIERRQNGIQLP